MSTQQARGVKSETTINDDMVVQYLQTYPDFFERNSTLLARLRLPHARESGQTISLVERQVDVLRERNRGLERKLKELIDVARANEVLTDKIHRFDRRLIRAGTMAETVSAVEASLREDFEAMHAVLVLFVAPSPELKPLEGPFLRVLPREHADLKMFDTFLTSAKPRCGQVRDAQRDYLFGAGNVEIGSVALAPLGPNAEFGFLAIGSSDSDRFHPTMSTDFLGRIGDHIREAIARFG
ncbi:MAG TPA: DUF484 family protein [Steroidobacteraceae bacterium]|jgi:hypothetical protein|nr:DUF484 family protein [Steroidobacteraceae bacterium]